MQYCTPGKGGLDQVQYIRLQRDYLMNLKYLSALVLAYGATLITSCASPLPELPSVLDAQPMISDKSSQVNGKDASVSRQRSGVPELYEEVDLTVLQR